MSNSCSKCGSPLDQNASLCSKCDNKVSDSTYMKNNNLSELKPDELVYPFQCKLSPTGAAILSVLVVGLGQMINGQLAKGLIMLIGGTVIGLITAGIAAIPIWIISGVDAYKCAKKLQSGEIIGKWSFF